MARLLCLLRKHLNNIIWSSDQVHTSVPYTVHNVAKALIISIFVLCCSCYSLQAFGGYLSLKMLAATDQLFKCAVAVAPITDFKLYSE